MKLSKLPTLTLGLLLSLASFSYVKCDEVEEVKKNTAKIGYQHPYIPGVIGGLTCTKFLKATIFKRFAAFSITTAMGTFLSQALSENYLKNTLNCFEWMAVKTPAFKTQTDKFKTKIQSFFS